MLLVLARKQRKLHFGSVSRFDFDFFQLAIERKESLTAPVLIPALPRLLGLGVSFLFYSQILLDCEKITSEMQSLISDPRLPGYVPLVS